MTNFSRRLRRWRGSTPAAVVVGAGDVASTASAVSSADASSYTFNGVTASDGTLVVAIGLRASPAPAISGVTADTVSMTLVGTTLNTADDSLSRVAYYAIEDWTGDGDVDIVVTLSVGSGRCGIVVHSVPTADIANMTYKSTSAAGAGTSTSITVDETADGVNLYYYFAGGTATQTWTGGPTKVVDEDVESNDQSAATEELTATASGQTVTVTGGTLQRRMMQAVEITY